MWIPASYRGTNAQAYRIIREHPFALLILTDPQTHQPVLTHIPVLNLSPLENSPWLLEGHVARANPAAKLLLAGGPATVVFQGPHAYISAGWYEDARTVSTWNYTAVHCHGTAQAVTDPALVRAGLDRLVADYEPAAGNWTEATHTDPGYVDKLQQGIVLFHLPVDRLECQVKMSQNRSAGDQQRIIEHLRATGRVGDGDVADWMADGH